MSMKPVRGVILVADRDLIAVVREQPEVAREIGRPVLEPNGDLFLDGPETPDDPRRRTVLLIYRGHGGVEGMDWEPDELARLQGLGVGHCAHVVEGNSTSLAARLIGALAQHARLAVDNDYGVLLSAEEFRALGPERQAEFIVGAGDFYRLGPIAGLEGSGAGTHDAG